MTCIMLQIIQNDLFPFFERLKHRLQRKHPRYRYVCHAISTDHLPLHLSMVVHSQDMDQMEFVIIVLLHYESGNLAITSWLGYEGDPPLAEMPSIILRDKSCDAEYARICLAIRKFLKNNIMIIDKSLAELGKR